MSKIKKADPAGVLASARDMVARITQQAKNGEIDGAMLDQLSGMLNISMDTAPDGQASEAGDAEGATEAPSTTPTPSMSGVDSQPSDGAEPPSAPSFDTGSFPSKSESMPSLPSGMKKRDEFGPFTTRPPSPAFVFDHQDDMAAQLPQFISMLENGHLGKAQQLAGNNVAFDTMFQMSCKAIMNQGGITYKNIAKMHGGAPALDSLDNETLQKAITSGDVPGIYLIRLAKLMLPVYAGLRRRLPAVTPTVGSNQATWRAQLGFGALNFATMMSVAEAAIGQAVPTAFLTFNAPYRPTTLNDAVTLQAIAASRGYDDPLQIAVIRAMAGLLQGEERVLLGQNAVAVAAPGTITGTPSTTGGSLAAGTYVVAVTALTYRGWVAGSAGGASALGESTATSSGVITTTLTLGASITATWAAVPGAVGYNVYLSPHNASPVTLYFNQTVLINKAVIKLESTGTVLPPGADTSINANGYEGLINWCELATVYGNAIPGKAAIVDNAGGGLTVGNGGIAQFDSVLASLWTNWQIAPSLMVMSPNMAGTVTGKLNGMANAPLYIINATQNQGELTGGVFLSGYTNKFALFADGSPRKIDFFAHPYMPDGTILFVTETIPYPMSREAQGFKIDVQIPYTYFPLAQNTIQYPFALTLAETLECFHPSAQTALVGVDWTL